MWNITGQFLSSTANVFGSAFGSMGAFSVGAVAVVLGLVSIFFGRRLHGPVSIVFGIVAGVMIATSPLPGLTAIQPAWLQMFAILAAGIVSTVVVAVLWRIAPMLAGAGAAVAFCLTMMQGLGFSTTVTLVIVVAFAAAGAILVSKLMDWGLILGSSLAGAVMIGAYATAVLGADNAIGWIVFAALASVGIWHQSRHLQHQREEAQAVWLLPEEPAVSN